MLDVRDGEGAVLVAARVRPRSRPGLYLTDGGLVISVAAAPEKGRATEEALRTLAAALAVAPSAVEIVRGVSARRKLFAVTGIDVVEVRARLLSVASG